MGNRIMRNGNYRKRIVTLAQSYYGPLKDTAQASVLDDKHLSMNSLTIGSS